jgi:thymidylate synthase
MLNLTIKNMARSVLTKERKIEILKAALKQYKHSSKERGLCYSIIRNETGFNTKDNDYIQRYIPEFSFANAKKLAIKYGFAEPTGNRYGYWWYRWEKRGQMARVKFINALIKELKNS